MIELNNESNDFGTVHISDEVLAVIAGTAALENEGIKGAVGNMAGEIVEKFGVKNYSKGVKITFEGEAVIVDLVLVVKSGYKIQDVSADVQQRVKNALETMTGLTVQRVNVTIQSLSMEKPSTDTEELTQ